MHLPSAVSLQRLRIPRGHVRLIVVAAVVLGAAVLLVALPDRAGPPPSVEGAVGKLTLERPSYLGVACAEPNMVQCGRVGFTVWLREPAASVEAIIAGERVRLSDAGYVKGDGRIFSGFLQRKGFISGTLGVRPDRPDGAWEGARDVPPVPVRVTAVSSKGDRSAIDLRVPLAPGYG